jgi:hypothetical protein
MDYDDFADIGLPNHDRHRTETTRMCWIFYLYRIWSCNSTANEWFEIRAQSAAPIITTTWGAKPRLIISRSA